MKKKPKHKSDGGMRPEYDFASMGDTTRGKYYERYQKGTNVVLLEPDVAKAFPTERAVNEALRGILSKTRVVPRSGVLTDRDLETGEYKRRSVSRKY